MVQSKQEQLRSHIFILLSLHSSSTIYISGTANDKITCFSVRLLKLAIMSSCIRISLLHLLCTSDWMVRVISQNWCPMFLSYFCSKKVKSKWKQLADFHSKKVNFSTSYSSAFFCHLPQVCFCQTTTHLSKSDEKFLYDSTSTSSHSLFSVNEITTLHLSTEVDVTYFDSLPNLLLGENSLRWELPAC